MCPKFELVKYATYFLVFKTNKFASKNARPIARPCRQVRNRIICKNVEWFKTWQQRITPQISSESSSISLYIHHLTSQTQKNVQNRKRRLRKSIDDVTVRQQPFFDLLLVPSPWEISEGEKPVFGWLKFKTFSGRHIFKVQNC